MRMITTEWKDESGKITSTRKEWVFTLEEVRNALCPYHENPDEFDWSIGAESDGYKELTVGATEYHE